MTKDEIIELAMAYGFTGGFNAQGDLTYDATFVEAVTEAVVKEREACADLCATFYDEMWEEYAEAGNELAEIIRARGEA